MRFAYANLLEVGLCHVEWNCRAPRKYDADEQTEKLTFVVPKLQRSLCDHIRFNRIETLTHFCFNGLKTAVQRLMANTAAMNHWKLV